MLKSMRTVSLQGLFDNDQSNMYREMFDQQLAVELHGTSRLADDHTPPRRGEGSRRSTFR
jgi:Rod binding domain-containing protein